MKLKKLIAVALALTLVFTGCGASEEGENSGGEQTATEASDDGSGEQASDSESGEQAAEGESGEQASDGESGDQTSEAQGEGETASDDDDYRERAVEVADGTLQASSTAIAVGETAVPYSEYRMYYYFMENLYDSLIGSDVWKQAADETNTIGHEAIEDVLRMIIQVKVIAKQAARQGVNLEADEKEDADYNATKLCESLDPEVINEAMITTPEMMKIFEENKLAEKMYNIITGQVAVDSSAKAVKLQQLFKAADDSNREQVRGEMDKLQKKIASSDKSFYFYAKRESENPDIETVIGSLDKRNNLLNAAQNEQIGSVSNVIEESDGFYIIYVLKRDDPEMDLEYQNNVTTDEQIKAFQDAYTKWSEHYEVEVSDALLTE